MLPDTLNPFSAPWMLHLRTVMLDDPMAVLFAFCPSISQSSSTRPVLLLSTTQNELDRIRDRRIVTSGALTTTGPLMSRASMTAPGVLIVIPPEGVNTVPRGTPLVEASGKPGDGVGQPLLDAGPGWFRQASSASSTPSLSASLSGGGG